MISLWLDMVNRGEDDGEGINNLQAAQKTEKKLQRQGRAGKTCSSVTTRLERLANGGPYDKKGGDRAAPDPGRGSADAFEL